MKTLLSVLMAACLMATNLGGMFSLSQLDSQERAIRNDPEIFSTTEGRDFDLSGCSENENSTSADGRSIYKTIELTSEPTVIEAITLPVSVYDHWPVSNPDQNTLTYVPDPESETDEADYFSGPQDFCIDEQGNFYILDTYGNKVVKVSDSGVIVETTAIENAGALSQIAYADGAVWVIDESNNSLIKIIDSSITAFDMPMIDLDNPEIPGAYRFAPLINSIYVEENGELILDGNHAGVFMFYDGIFTSTTSNFSRSVKDDILTISSKDFSWEIPVFGCGVEILGSDEFGNLYVVVNDAFIDSNGILCGDDSIRIYDKNSQPVSAAFVNSVERDILPIHPIELDSNCDFWELRCYEDRVCLEHIIPANCKATEKSLFNSAKNVDNIDSNDNTRTETYVFNNNGFQAEEKMKQYAVQTWNVSTLNIHVFQTGTDVHQTIINAANSSSNHTLTGIPYAMGRYKSINTFLNNLTTVYREGYYYCASDVSQNSHSGTTGVDCSGYAERVYNLNGCNKKYGSGDFESAGIIVGSGNNNLASLASSAKRLDYWVDGGYHVMIHFNYSSGDTVINVYDASRNLGFVLNRNWTIATMKKHSFKLKTPWHSGACSCGSTYYSDSNYHWNRCTNSSCQRRLNIQSHTIVPHGSGYKCTICNKYFSNPQPDLETPFDRNNQ